MSLAAAPIVAVVALGAGAGETGLLQTAQTLPFLFFAIPAGLLADRMARGPLLASTEALRMLSLLGILALARMGGLSVPLLALLGLIGACGTVAFSVAVPALVPSLVPADALAAANGRVELARTVAFTAGPALAGAVIGWTGAAAAFGIAAAFSAGAVVMLAGVREPVRPPMARRLPLLELREGAAFVFRHPLLRPVFVTQVFFNAAFLVFHTAYVPHAVHRLGLSASGVGITLAICGIGMIVGALLATRIIAGVPFGAVVAFGPIAALAASVLMVVTIWTPSVTLAAVSFFLLGVGPIVWVISTATLRQTVTPPSLLGRVSAINILGYGARPVGAAIGAVIGAIYGAQTCLVVAAIGFAIQVAIIVVSPVRRLDRQPVMGE